MPVQITLFFHHLLYPYLSFGCLVAVTGLDHNRLFIFDFCASEMAGCSSLGNLAHFCASEMAVSVKMSSFLQQKFKQQKFGNINYPYF
jgi:hypothetical protein